MLGQLRLLCLQLLVHKPLTFILLLLDSPVERSETTDQARILGIGPAERLVERRNHPMALWNENLRLVLPNLTSSQYGCHRQVLAELA